MIKAILVSIILILNTACASNFYFYGRTNLIENVERQVYAAIPDAGKGKGKNYLSIGTYIEDPNDNKYSYLIVCHKAVITVDGQNVELDTESYIQSVFPEYASYFCNPQDAWDAMAYWAFI